MLSTVNVTTQPAIEPVAREVVKRHCRIDHASDDDLIDIYIRAARHVAERYMGRAIITQTVQWVVTPEDDLRPRHSRLWGDLVLPRGPVQSITSVIVNDRLGNSTTIAAGTLPYVPPSPLLGYMADIAHTRARVWIGGQTSMIDGRTFGQIELMNLEITYVAGYATLAKDLPSPIVTAVMMIVAALYENRGDMGGEMPMEARNLLDFYRVVPV